MTDKEYDITCEICEKPMERTSTTSVALGGYIIYYACRECEGETYTVTECLCGRAVIRAGWNDMTDKLISVKDRLPAEGVYVLGRYSGGNWVCDQDQEGVEWVSVCLSRVGCVGDDYGWSQFGPADYTKDDIDAWVPFPSACRPSKDRGFIG